MPRNGAGLMTLVHDWESDDAADIPIQSDRFMEQEQDIADALTASIASDGQTTPSADLPMGGFGHTGVRAATNASDYLRADQVQKNTLTYFVATGTDTYTITPSPTVTLAAGMAFLVLFTNANTTSATLTVGAATAKALTKNTSEALVLGDITAGMLAWCPYDGTRFQIQRVATSALDEGALALYSGVMGL